MEITREDKIAAGIGNYRRVRKVAIPRQTTGRPAKFVAVNGRPMLRTNHLSLKKLKGKIKTATKKVGSSAKKGIKKAAKATGKAVKKTVKVVAKVSKTLALAPAIAPLIPLKPVMAKALKKKGFAAPKKTLDLAEAFYKHIVKGDNYDMPNIERRSNDDHFAPLALVPPIIKFIKDAIDKKKAKKSGQVQGVELTPVEQLVADESENVVAKIETAAKDAGIAPAELPGSNSRESSESGRSSGDESEAPDRERKEAKKKRGGKKDGGDSSGGSSMSLESMKWPLIIGGAGVVAFIALKK